MLCRSPGWSLHLRSSCACLLGLSSDSSYTPSSGRRHWTASCLTCRCDYWGSSRRIRRSPCFLYRRRRTSSTPPWLCRSHRTSDDHLSPSPCRRKWLYPSYRRRRSTYGSGLYCLYPTRWNSCGRLLRSFARIRTRASACHHLFSSRWNSCGRLRHSFARIRTRASACYYRSSSRWNSCGRLCPSLCRSFCTCDSGWFRHCSTSLCRRHGRTPQGLYHLNA